MSAPILLKHLKFAIFVCTLPGTERASNSPIHPITSPLSQKMSPPVSPPVYPSVLKDRPSIPCVGSPSNIRAPPPVPPRGVRTKRYQGFTKGVT